MDAAAWILVIIQQDSGGGEGGGSWRDQTFNATTGGPVAGWW